ncbi:MAG: TetR/AcrR family transcriptional regulator; helix-turn-helix transcriptional regulator [Parvibaculum sp.]|uniref:TetR/AcrR family transcriptional regulator n=1 Tax=Parvibaculum sp. TaxID=2024848 RepID=UPI0025CE773A|nr:TetR/AcrR family transcriptional regulator [Parvibaculum sp.]MCE9648637.1 TetR/AcrR family transcriptional regulator; helix-turn-helix transcriptional regulator [Parvibaculum sp.]
MAKSSVATAAKAQGGRTAAPKAATPKAGSGDKPSLILDAALSLFRQYGYRRTSMEDIAQAANVAKGTLYIYFKSKDELFEALARRLAAQIDADAGAVVEKPLPFEDKVLALLDAKLGFVYRWVLSSPHAAELTDPTSRLPDDVFGPVDRDYRATMAKLFKEAARLGEIDLKGAGLTPETATDTLIAAAHGAEKGALDEADFHERLVRIGRLALRGLRPRG